MISTIWAVVRAVSAGPSVVDALRRYPYLIADSGFGDVARDLPAGSSGPAGRSAPANGQQKPPPAAGRPAERRGPLRHSEKKDEPPPPPPPEKPKKIEGMPDYSIQVDVPAGASAGHGDHQRRAVHLQLETREFPHVRRWRAAEPSATSLSRKRRSRPCCWSSLPLTNYSFMVDALNASYSFASTLKKDDWVAVISYDMRPQILADFTQDKQAGLRRAESVAHAGFLRDQSVRRLYDTLDRIDRIEGHKYIILISTGFDTFSKLNLDQIMKKIKATQDVTIFPDQRGMGSCGNTAKSRGMRRTRTELGIPVNQMDYLQADNEMQTFARLTGGRYYFPRFQAEFPEIFHDIAATFATSTNCLPSHQSQARWHLPQTESRSRGAGRRSAEEYEIRRAKT